MTPLPPQHAFRCADAARERGDGIAGTAPRGTYWVLVEHRGGWPPNGFDGLDLDAEVYAQVFAAAQALRARILLIRRHGRRSRASTGQWAVMHLAGPGDLRQIWGRWRHDEDLRAIPEALTEVADPANAGRLSGDPVLLVCAHGQHDVCCAVRGRPVAAALAARWPESVWECSHVGGDRFAANVLVVPDGVYYGNLEADSTVAVIEDHMQGLIGAEHLRGYTDLAPVEQVAVSAALEHWGPAGRFDHRIDSAAFEDGRWRVRVRRLRSGVGTKVRAAGAEDQQELAAQQLLEVELSASRTEPRQLTCRGLQKAVAAAFTVEHVRELLGPSPGTTPRSTM